MLKIRSATKVNILIEMGLYLNGLNLFSQYLPKQFVEYKPEKTRMMAVIVNNNVYVFKNTTSVMTSTLH